MKNILTCIIEISVICFFCIFSELTLADQTQSDQKKLLPTDVIMKERPLPQRHDQCHLCHIKKRKLFISAKRKTIIEHAGYVNEHGNIMQECHSCHDINNSNYLKNTPLAPADFKNPSFVCKRCHVTEFRSWVYGAHGLRTGNWNGLKTQSNCTECHKPHSVRYKPMQALPPPKRLHEIQSQ